MGTGRDRRFGRTIAALLCLIAIGLAAKSWNGPGRIWVRDFFAGVIYVMFWIVLARGLSVRASTTRIAAIVLAITCGLEVLQLWKPAWLGAIRATWPGRALIGTTFSWLDFPHYVAGAFLGAGLARWTSAPAGAPPTQGGETNR